MLRGEYTVILEQKGNVTKISLIYLRAISVYTSAGFSLATKLTAAASS